MIRKLVLSALMFSAISILPVAADTGWIGSGTAASGSNPASATVKWVRQDVSGWAKFKINEFSSSVPADRIWKFDGNSSVGKNWLAILLSAQASATPIQFYEIENYPNEVPGAIPPIYFWKMDALTVGGSN